MTIGKSKAKYAERETGNLSLGQYGQQFSSGTTAVTGKVIVAIQFVTNTTFTTLTPETSDFIGTSGGAGDDVTNGDIFPAGLTIFGQWTGYELNYGSVIPYFG